MSYFSRSHGGSQAWECKMCTDPDPYERFEGFFKTVYVYVCICIYVFIYNYVRVCM